MSRPKGLLLDRGISECTDDEDPPPWDDRRRVCARTDVGDGVPPVMDETEEEIELRELMEDEVVMEDRLVSDFLPLR